MCRDFNDGFGVSRRVLMRSRKEALCIMLMKALWSWGLGLCLVVSSRVGVTGLELKGRGSRGCSFSERFSADQFPEDAIDQSIKSNQRFHYILVVHGCRTIAGLLGGRVVKKRCLPP